MATGCTALEEFLVLLAGALATAVGAYVKHRSATKAAYEKGVRDGRA